MTLDAIPQPLDAAIELLAGRGRILVATDFDGTLSDLVDDPSTSRPVAGAVETLDALSLVDGVTVAVVSGRTLHDLETLLGVGDMVELVGEHGAVRRGGGALVPSGFDVSSLDTLVDRLATVVAAVPGARLEVKSTSVVVHSRHVAIERSEALRNRVVSILSELGVEHWDFGHDVVDIRLAAVSKGDAVDALRIESNADAVLFFGDDISDEAAMRRMGADDLGVRVGEGPTAAHHVVDGPPQVVAILRRLLGLLTAR